MQREKQFTSDVAHELRTPISVVLMQCEDLLQGNHLDEEGRREVSVIHRKMNPFLIWCPSFCSFPGRTREGKS